MSKPQLQKRYLHKKRKSFGDSVDVSEHATQPEKVEEENNAASASNTATNVPNATPRSKSPANSTLPTAEPVTPRPPSVSAAITLMNASPGSQTLPATTLSNSSTLPQGPSTTTSANSALFSQIRRQQRLRARPQYFQMHRQ